MMSQQPGWCRRCDGRGVVEIKPDAEFGPAGVRIWARQSCPECARRCLPALVGAEEGFYLDPSGNVWGVDSDGAWFAEGGIGARRVGEAEQRKHGPYRKLKPAVCGCGECER